MPGSSLLSHGETPHYHRRYGVSLLSSAWGQVGPPRYGRQQILLPETNLLSFVPENPESVLKIFSHPPKHLRRCKVKPHGSLVPVSSTHRCAYTPGLSTSSSSTFLQETLSLRRTHLGASFVLRCFQHLSLPHLATGQCHWHDNPNTSDASTPVLSY